MTLRSIKLKTRAEAFCAKLNDGLAAVAFVLAMAVFIAGTYRTIEMVAMNAQEGMLATDVSGVPQVPQ